jgi:glycosidase
MIIGLVGLCSAQGARPWTDEVMYFVMTDRFLDGDPSNNIPAGCDPALYDPAQNDINRYMGGDLRGLERAIQAGYFNDLGVTALWLTPVVRNVWRSGYDLGGWKSGYHGYWAQDWLDIDPHLTSRTSLDGREYEDSAEGRMEHYRDFVALARSRGIRIIQDVVLNHAGPVFFYDHNGNGVFDVEEKEEWILPFKRDGYYDSARWGDVPKWNIRRTMPDGPRELLGAKINTTGVLSRIETYARKGFSWDSLGKSDGEEIMADFFSLRTFWSAPDAAHFDELIDEFVEIYHFYMTVVGVDGLRVDTVKHMQHEVWDAFTERLRARLGTAAAEKIMFGEIYDGNPERLGQYTWRSDWPERTDPALDSVLDFQFCFTAREYLRHNGDATGSPYAVNEAILTRQRDGVLGRPYYNPNPGPDGLNARQKMITFIENHDGINRFRVEEVTEIRHRLAQALVMTLPGIPCLYYGAEAGLHDTRGRVGADSETGRMMFFRRDGVLDVAAVRQSASFRDIAALARLRESHPVLRTGDYLPLWVDSRDSNDDDGVFAFGRMMADDPWSMVVVVFNAAANDAVTGAGEAGISLPVELEGASLRPLLVIGDSAAPAATAVAAGMRLPAPASTMVAWEVVRPAGN